MKTKLLAIMLSLGLAFGTVSCETASLQELKPLVLPATVLVLKKPIEKDPSKADKFLKIADRLDTLVDVTEKELTLDDFLKVSKDLGVDKEWAVLASSVYDIYKPKVDTQNLSAAKAAVKEFAKVIRDAVNVLKPTK